MTVSHLSRYSDPESSHAAADEHVKSGRNLTQRRAIWKALRANPGKTSRELAQIMGIDRYIVARRLPELVRDGFAIRGPEVTCAVGNRPACVWYTSDARSPAPLGERASGPPRPAAVTPLRSIPSESSGDRASTTRGELAARKRGLEPREPGSNPGASDQLSIADLFGGERW